MTKKNSRSKAKNTKRQEDRVEHAAEQVEAIVEPLAEPEVRPRKFTKASRSQIAAERIEDEYAYIVGDLRQVFLLAAALFALLIILNVIFSLIG